MSLPTYCPLKLMASRSLAKAASPMWGGFNADDTCDRAMCGFWSVKASMCGIAAMAGTLNAAGDNLPQPDPVPEDPVQEDVPLLNNKVTA